ncbi:DedA family protein [Paenibacillus antarcticus]|uniref:Alkaline phosphatase n=1 Tax=Paenibacillus antarcticus TaxID=253703 RepID=A0A168KY14_9BACL|nr:DedA family protein [Paenibacillus antarcticus]OAB42612.1 alkaline phosphatase [Paenibacillus antarcticus]
MEVLRWIQLLFEEYGYLVLFVGLLLEFIALPFPGETTMAYAGYLSYLGSLDFGWLLIMAFLGTTIGMTITYFIGLRAGLPFVNRFGKWIFLSPRKLEKTRKWFSKYGHNLILIGYFIPGVRHFTGYFSGLNALPFRKFALYAYSGALFWVILFLSVGRIFGPQWQVAFHLAEMYSLWIVGGIFIIALIYISYRFRKKAMLTVSTKSSKKRVKRSS